jgi:PAS domain S-box-containing protein
VKVLPQFSLSQKVLILVTLPLLAQVFLMIGLTKVQADSEKQLAEANLARNISDAVNHLNTDIYELVAAYGDERSVISISTSDKSFIDYRSRFDKDFGELRTLAAKKPDILVSIDQAEQSAHQAIADLLELKNDLILYGSHFRDERRPLWKKLRAHTMQAIDSQLFSVGERERRLANQTPEIQAALRQGQQRIMIAGAILGILLTLIIAAILTKSITQRLAKMTENTYKLASGEPLHPVQGGADDISKLDQVFHSMASALEGAARKESAFIDSANDVLCMIASGGRITSINPACQERFGFTKDDLLGSHLSDLVIVVDQSRARSYLDKLHEGIAQEPIELKMRRLDRTVADTLWSAQWSKEEDSFFCIIHDITQIRDAERTKQEVLAMVTHDLKTPLTTLGNALEILPNAAPEKRAQYFAMARRNVEHMTNLVADLLDIEKAKAGMMKLAKEQIDLSECFNSTLDATTGMAEAKKVRVICQAPDLTVEADPEALTRVMINLVSNAIKFSPPGSEVIIGADKTPGLIHVWIQDQGKGIPAAELDKVFERFHQVSESGGANNAGGTGLGLAICKEFVRLHGGNIWAESQPGKGSKFTFTLPS